MQQSAVRLYSGAWPPSCCPAQCNRLSCISVTDALARLGSHQPGKTPCPAATGCMLAACRPSQPDGHTSHTPGAPFCGSWAMGLASCCVHKILLTRSAHSRAVLHSEIELWAGQLVRWHTALQCVSSGFQLCGHAWALWNRPAPCALHLSYGSVLIPESAADFATCTRSTPAL